MSRVRIERIELRLKNVDARVAQAAAQSLGSTLAPALAARLAGGADAVAPLGARPDAAQLREALGAQIARAVHARLGAALPRKGRD